MFHSGEEALALLSSAKKCLATTNRLAYYVKDDITQNHFG